jgi:hypothetical protein
MTRILKDNVVETSTTTGLGDITLAGAVTGFFAFSQVCSVGDTFYYQIEAIDGSGNRTGAQECGLGTYSALNTLTRTLVQSSSNANAAVNFGAGTKRCMIAKTAASFDFRGAKAKKVADQTAQNFTTAAAVIWDTEDYDTDALHDNVTNNSRMTVPADVSYVKLIGSVRLANVTASNAVVLTIRKNGTTTISQSCGNITLTNPGLIILSAVEAVVATDYFELLIQIGTDTSVDITAQGSFFAMEVVR